MALKDQIEGLQKALEESKRQHLDLTKVYQEERAARKAAEENLQSYRGADESLRAAAKAGVEAIEAWQERFDRLLSLSEKALDAAERDY